MKTILIKLLRHGLTAVGGVGMATDSNVDQIAGAISFLAGIAWSIYESRNTKPPSDPAAASVAGKIIPLLFMCSILSSGCTAPILPGNDPVVVRAEQARTVAADTFQAFVKLEYLNRPALKVISPDFARIADLVRDRSDGWIQSLTRVLAAYKANRTADNRASLTAGLATLDSALREVELHTAIATQYRIAR